tara:strand:+ start:37 stop:438 length:402 start_codon:yes stop_codon:yes gene_type:complete
MFDFHRFGGRNYLIALTILAMVFLLTSNAVAKEKNNYQGLPPVSGVELVIKNCTVCHSADIILANHMSRKAWDKTITWMQKEQGLWELNKEVRKIILDYLSKTQGISANKVLRGPIRKNSNQMYEFDYRANPL